MMDSISHLKGVASKGDKFRERGGDGGALRGRKRGRTAHGAGSMEAEPSIDARSMKNMSAIRKESQYFAIFIISQTNRTRSIMGGRKSLFLAIDDFGVAF